MAGIAGHATLVRASDAAKARWGVFHPEPAPVAAIAAGLRRAVRPAGILNRGRMGAAGGRGGLMQTTFTPEQLADPATARSNRILRTCVHCGFCTATCPTYQVLGDELDSPRGRIYLIKDMLETGRPADAKTVKHIDRCLSCLACMTTCPSGVHYMHLVDHARAYIERTYRRPLPERALRAALAAVLPHPARFRLALRAAAARAGRSPALLPDAAARRCWRWRRARLPPRADWTAAGVPAPRASASGGWRCSTGCAQRVLDPAINAATIRLLTRHGCEVVVAEGAGCCGALTHHMGKAAREPRGRGANVRAWIAEASGEGLDAVVDQHLGLRHHGQGLRPHVRRRPARRAARRGWPGWRATSRELMAELGLRPPVAGLPQLRVAYHAACSLQHGQQVRDAAEGAAEGRRLRGGRAARRPPLLRLGRHLQPAAAGDRGRAAGAARSRRSRSAART